MKLYARNSPQRATTDASAAQLAHCSRAAARAAAHRRVMRVPLPLVLCCCAAAITAVYGVTVSPDLPPITVPYAGLPQPVELPFNYVYTDPTTGVTFTTVKTVPGCAPEQVQLSYAGADKKGRVSVIVSWATCDAIVDSPPAWGTCAGTSQAGIVTGPLATKGLKPTVYFGTTSSPQDTGDQATGKSNSYVFSFDPYGDFRYASPVLNRVILKGLERGARYYFAIADNVESATQSKATLRKLSKGELGPNPYNGSFVTPGNSGELTAQFPFNVGIIGDPGQTYNVTSTLTHLMTSWPVAGAPGGTQWDEGGLQLLIITGDMSYAEETADISTTVPPGCTLGGLAYTYPPRWDTWGRFIQPLMSVIPTLTGEPAGLAPPYGTNFTYRQQEYNARLPTHRDSFTKLPKTTPVTTKKKDAYANGYYMKVVPGVATMIFLTSYSPADIDDSAPDLNGFSAKSPQYKWLEKKLKKVDRSKTPWVVVVWHAPWYTSYQSHFKENVCMQQVYEPLLTQYSVDLVFNGHVHSYERVKPVNNWELDATGCAPAYFVLGNAGNIEGVDTKFVTANFSSYCADPTSRTFPTSQPQACFVYNTGPGSGCAGSAACYCWDTQPAWSAYREPAFGHGRLIFESATQASWSWTRNVGGTPSVADAVNITRVPSCTSSTFKRAIN